MKIKRRLHNRLAELLFPRACRERKELRVALAKSRLAASRVARAAAGLVPDVKARA